MEIDLDKINNEIKNSKIFETEIPYKTDENSPVFEFFKVTKVLKYNPKYGDNRICKCGHSYYRHFDSYENMSYAGCKYCHGDECHGFEEEEIKVGDDVEIISDGITKGKKAKVVDNDSKDKDYKVSFGDAWQGYYMKNEIRKIQ